MTAPKFELRGRHVLAALLAFFAIIIAVNFTFAVYAVRSFPGEDVQRSYTQGLHYNETLAARRVQAALGWRASAELRASARDAILEVALSARDGAPVEGALISGSLEWPPSSRLDRALVFEPAGRGRYVARIAMLAPGRWRLRASARRGEEALDFEAELAWRQLG